MPKHPQYAVNHCFKVAVALTVHQCDTSVSSDAIWVDDTADPKCTRDSWDHGVELILILFMDQ